MTRDWGGYRIAANRNVTRDSFGFITQAVFLWVPSV